MSDFLLRGRASVSRAAILSVVGGVSVAALSVGGVALAADTNVPAGTTQTSPATAGGSDTVTIGAGGALSTTTSQALLLSGAMTGVTITNNGTISTSASGGRAIDTNNANVARTFTLDNEAGATISSDDDAIRIRGTIGGGTVTVNNSGSIHSATGQALDFDKAGGGTVLINNDVTGIISAGIGADVIRPGGNATITNYGTIQSDADSTAFNGDGIDFQANSGGSVDNYGLIEGSKHGITGDNGATVVNEADGVIRGRNGSGINYDTSGSAPAVSITNYGLISGEAQVTTSTDTDGDGVDVDGLVAIDNYGTIQALGARGYKDGVLTDPNISDGVSIGGGTVNNYAGAIISSVGRGILSDDSEGGAAFSATDIYNEGTITSGADWATITLRGDWADTLVNKGSISGDVLMGGGDDQVTLYVGQSIGGTLDGEDGTDTLTLAGTGSALIGKIANFEALDVRGGSWTLSDDQTYANGAEIDAGASLEVDHTLTAAVTIHADGTLSGTGTVTSIDAEAGSTLSPGGDGAIGTLTATGGVTLTAAALDIDIASDGTSDKLASSGAVTIDGGTLALNAASGAYQVGTRYDIATGASTTGSFDDVTSSFLFIDPTVSVGSDTVSVTLDRNDVGFASVATTDNARSVANSLEDANSGDDLYRWIVSSTDNVAAAKSLVELAGEVHADVAGNLMQQSTQAGDSILSRLASLGAPPVQPGAPDSAAMGYADEDKKPSSAAFAAMQPVSTIYSGWSQAFGGWQSSGSDGNAAEAKSSVGGGLVGADLSNDRYVLGLAGGYSWGSSKVDSQDASADVQTGLLALYGGVSFDAVKLRGGASIAWSSIDSSRTVTVGDLTEKPHASYDATTTDVFAELAYQAHLGGSILEPYAGLGWSHVDLDGFTESNAPVTGLSSDGSSFDTPYATLGVRASTDVFANGVKISPRGMVGWRHAFDDVSPSADVTLNNTGTSFQTQGAPIARDSFLLEAGADVAVTKNASVGLTYSGSFGNDASSNAIRAVGEIKF